MSRIYIFIPVLMATLTSCYLTKPLYTEQCDFGSKLIIASINEKSIEATSSFISGFAHDGRNTALVGVSIYADQGSFGTVSDIDGTFFLDLSDCERMPEIIKIAWDQSVVEIKFEIIRNKQIEIVSFYGGGSNIVRFKRPFFKRVGDMVTGNEIYKSLK